MPTHFEELWVEGEKLHQDTAPGTPALAIVNELTMKVNFYKAMEQKTELPPEELRQFKIRAMGEILLTLTKLSLKDNINVFDALNTAMQYRSIENHAKKLPT